MQNNSSVLLEVNEENCKKGNYFINKNILEIKSGDDKILDISKFVKLSENLLAKYVTLDWEHISNIALLINNIREYKHDTTRTRPYNILMHASPGSGKSHFINCLANKLDELKIEAINFNLSGINSIDDLINPIEIVRNIKVKDKLPLLFIDEFDSGNKLYEYLLPLLWDGELFIGNRYLKVGKIIIVLAGSTKIIKEFLISSRDADKEIAIPANREKLLDLLSRVNGGEFSIPDLEENKVDKILICISILKSRWPDIIFIPWALLNFIANVKFRYSVRSIHHLIYSIPSSSNANTDILDIQSLNTVLSSKEIFVKSNIRLHLFSPHGIDHIVKLWNDNYQYKQLIKISDVIENKPFLEEIQIMVSQIDKLLNSD